MQPENHLFAERLRHDRNGVFEQIYEQAFPRVARLVQRAGGSPADARDVFHDALIILYEKAVQGQLRISGSPQSYVAGIARHLWLRRLRDEPRWVDLDEAPQAQHLPGEEDHTEPLLRRVSRQLEAAGRKCLDLLQAFYYERLSMQEIAESFGYGSERSATVQKYKCLEKVRDGVRAGDKAGISFNHR